MSALPSEIGPHSESVESHDNRDMSGTAQAFVDSLRLELNIEGTSESLKTFSEMEGMRRNTWPGDHRAIVALVFGLAAKADLRVEIVEQERREYFRFTLPKSSR